MLHSFVNYFFYQFHNLLLLKRSKPFLSVPEVNKFFPRLKTLPNIPAPLPSWSHCPSLIYSYISRQMFLLILSYVATKELPLSKVTRFGVTFRLSNILSLTISSASILPIEPRIGAAKAAIGKATLFCLSFSFTAYIPNAACY